MERLEPIVLRGEIPDPTRIPSGCRFHPRCPALASGEADAGGRRLPRYGAAGPARRPRRAPRAPVTWWRSSASADVDRRRWRHDPAGRAAARAVRRSRGLGARARAGAAARVDLRRPGRRPRSPRARAGRGRRGARASRCCVTSDADGALHAAYNVCRHRGSQLFPTEPGTRAAAVRGEVDPLPVPLVDLRPRRLAAACPAHRGGRRRAAGVLAARRRASRSGAGSSSCTRRRRRRAAGRQSSAGRRARSAQLRPRRRWSPG